jgi:hypothetical protein
MTFKTVVLLFIFLGCWGVSQGQRKTDYQKAIKVNLLGPLTGLYSAQFETNASKRVSFLLTGFYRQQSGIPFAQEIDNLAKSRGLGITGVNFEYIFIDQAEIGVKGVSPELRFYLSRKKHPTFIGFFGQYTDIDMLVPASLPIVIRDQFLEIILPINFKIKSITGGLLLGKSFRFGRIGVDAVIIGGQIGRAYKVNATVNQSLISQLNNEEKESLRQGVIDRFGIDESYYDTEVINDGATLNQKKRVPFFGIRGAGLNLAYYF